MPRHSILVVEDDPAIRCGIVDALQYEGYQTIEAGDGTTGLDLALRREYDLLLLDLILPGPGGLEILAALRAARPTQPVIILTARGGEDDRVQGLRLGADDYVVKPFSVKELMARVTAVLRRSPERPSDLTIVPIPAGTADLARLEVKFTDGTKEELSNREAELLRYMARSAGRVVSRDELLSRVWQVDPKTYESRTVDVHIARLRNKLRDDADQGQLITTVRGKGYIFSAYGADE